MADERDLRPAGDGEDAAAERFERYLEAVLSDGRPSPDDVTEGDEAEMARLAAELHAATDPDTGTPDAAFVEQLRLRMRQADAGIAAVREPLPYRPGIADPGPAGRIRITRRQLLGGGLVAGAGIAAGAVGASILRPVANGGGSFTGGNELVGDNGFWAPVAALTDVPPGSAVRFSTAAFDGFVVNDGGEIRALSAICTHMGCALHFRPEWQDLRCACHAASFDLTGALANGRDRWRATGGYRGDAHAYPVALPALARPRVKVQDGQVLVWTVQV
jgi:nitrite reductase/ring-hydroxylating ferredoxin subunit